MDANFDGVVTRDELAMLLRSLSEYVSDEEIDEMMIKADVNRDGMI